MNGTPVPPRRTVKVDLYRDWIAHIKRELNAMGWDLARFRGDIEVVHAYLNRHKRLVQARPRVVRKAAGFSCPPSLATGLSEVERKIVAGENLAPHLSRRLGDPFFNDGILNDWGIHHLHLGTVADPDGFMKRTDPVLFVRFDDTTAYLLHFWSHGSWTDRAALESIHTNWPDSIRQWRVHGITGMQRGTLSDHEFAKLRGGNVSVLHQMSDGTVYGSIGGGYMSSGIALDIVWTADRWKLQLGAVQQNLIDNIETIDAEARKQGVSLPDPAEFELVFVDGTALAREITSRVGVPLGI